MENVRVVLNSYGEEPKELYFVPKEGCYLEQKLTTYGDAVIYRIYNVHPTPKKKWYQIGDCLLVELLLTMNMNEIKYVVYDE